MKKVLLVLMILTSLIFVACGTNTAEKVEAPIVESEQTQSEPASEPEPVTEVFKIGDTVSIGDVEFTVNNARFDKGSDFSKPEEGMKYLVIDATVENKSNEPFALSSMMCFTLYDEEDYACDMQIFAETKGSLDGEIAPGRKIKGEIAFDVSADQKKWELVFKPDLVITGQAIYEIPVESVVQ